MITRIRTTQSYLIRGRTGTVIAIIKGNPRIGQPDTVRVEYSDGTRETFLKRFFKNEAELA